ncbi:MAG: hypothetical protein JWQ37_3024, partial [Blastococcus sp.]|nr:hypothetical protein [Blastococcus sp.]
MRWLGPGVVALLLTLAGCSSSGAATGQPAAGVHDQLDGDARDHAAAGTGPDGTRSTAAR